MKNKKILIEKPEAISIPYLRDVKDYCIIFEYSGIKYELWNDLDDLDHPVFILQIIHEPFSNEIICQVPRTYPNVASLYRFNGDGKRSRENFDYCYFAEQLEIIGVAEYTQLMRRYNEILYISNRLEEIRNELNADKKHLEHMKSDESIANINDTLSKIQKDLKKMVCNDLCYDELKKNYSIENLC